MSGSCISRHSAKCKNHSSRSSKEARKKQLVLEAAKEKARIQLKLAADLAAVDKKYSPPTSECSSQHDSKDTQKWLERSQQELEEQRATNRQTPTSPLFPPPDEAGTNGPVQQLVSALRDLVTSVSTTPNSYPPNSQELEEQRATIRQTPTSPLFPPPDEAGTNGPVQQLVSALRDLVTSVSTTPNSYPPNGVSTVSTQLSTCSANLTNIQRDNKHKQTENNSNQTVLLQTVKRDEQSDNKKCSFCRNYKHNLNDCEKFKNSLRKYVKRVGICCKCLLSQHDSQTCPAAVCDVDECGEQHHRLLHYVPSALQNNISVQTYPTESANTETETSVKSEMINSTTTTTHNRQTNHCSVLQKVIPTNIYGPSDIFYYYYYYGDYGPSVPTVSMMSAKPAARAGLRGHKQSIQVRGAWDSTMLLCETKLLDLMVSNKHGDEYNISVRSVNDLSLPTQNLPLVKFENYTYFRKNEWCSSPQKPEIITGQKVPTKREMLRVVMTIFDVYGFLSPITINGKLILQETWRLNIGWDDPVSHEIYTKWQKWICLLQSVHDVTLPRHYPAATRVSETESRSTCATLPDSATLVAERISATSTTSATPHTPSNNYYEKKQLSTSTYYRNLQMHIFCDASAKAMCAVAYWRWEHNDCVRVAFIASRCRVAPVKLVSVPRLELQAAVLAARLAETITKEHKMKTERKIFWCDSSTVLTWIRNDARNYKQYVAHRLGEIDELSNLNDWRYVPTKLNVADIATRESYDCSLLEKEWLYGPAFLYKDSREWPQDVIDPKNKECTLECITLINTNENKVDLPVPDPTKFSSWLRLLRCMSRVLTFVDSGIKAVNKKFGHKKLTYNLDENVMERAERLLLIYSQGQSFREEITLLRASKSLFTTSRLLTLSPYLDDHGVLRAGGRIDAAADVLVDMKRPAILDGKDYITRLLVRHYHVSAAHGNQETVVNELKQKYWILKLRPTVKNVAAKCMRCRLRKCEPEIPRIGDLPSGRMAHHQRPFSHCGVDLFGPMEVTVGRRHERRYGVLFTCLTVRAIHIETVASLTTDSFIMCLRRMAARRGWPCQIYSDNGTNLKGADAELKKAMKDLEQEGIRIEAENHGTKWTFIPPASPHWGGAWERLIRSVKTSLKIILKERAPKEETFITLLAEIENIVNSRPLTHVSVEPGSMETLTPNHFLIGTSSNSPQIGKFDDSDLFLRRQWRISQRLADMFWNRWVKEVLPDLLPRRKWKTEQRPLQVGDLVFVVDPDGPRNMWPKGLIQAVYPGKDGRVRRVTVKTKTGVLTRSAARVARVPMADECC